MTDVETRLREMMRHVVDEVQPPPDVLTGVRRRYRRRSRARLVGVAAVASAVAVITLAAVTLTNDTAHRGVQPASFPGSGRLLLAVHNDLVWLYPDGHQTVIARGFADASMQGQYLVARRYVHHATSYYLMRLDGTGQRLLVPPPRAPHPDNLVPALSPDGRYVAYLQQITGLPHGQVQHRLYIRDLDTGRTRDLPIFATPFWWQNSSTLLAAPDARSLVTIDAATGTRTPYLSASNPAIVAAYKAAKPTAAAPAFIEADGWRDGPGLGPLAVWVASPSPNSGYWSKPIEVLYDGVTVTRTYAPPTPQQLDTSWGPNGLLLFTTGPGGTPGWDTYAATATSNALSRPLLYGQTGVTSNPTGTVLAMQDDNLITFAPVPPPACSSLNDCEHFALKFMSGRGRLLAWAR